jgi:hypothetical protein
MNPLSSGATTRSTPRYIFMLAAKYLGKVTRWLFYQWQGPADPLSRWDSGVIGPDGSARPGFFCPAQRPVAPIRLRWGHTSGMTASPRTSWARG